LVCPKGRPRAPLKTKGRGEKKEEKRREREKRRETKMLILYFNVSIDSAYNTTRSFCSRSRRAQRG